MKIVVVEDSPTQAARLRVLLETNGWDVAVAKNGVDGLALCERHRPDVLLSDIVMPGLDGFELCRRVTTSASLRDIPVVLLTSLHEPSDVVHALAAGAANYVTKPYDEADLLGRVQRTVTRAHANTPELEVLGESVRIDAEPRRMLDLLVSALEDAQKRTEESERARRALEASQEENRRLYDEALRANRAKDEFLAVVSHELRTPLSAISGWARLLREGALDEARRARAIDSIERNATAQARLIEDVLDVSRVIAGKLSLEWSRVSLGRLVGDAIASFEPEANAKGVRIEHLVSAEDDHLEIEGDPDRLAQVLKNLVANALKFTPAGARVSVVALCSNGSARIEVRDEGIGIESDFLPRVFQPFEQADGSATRAHGGLGLGLAIAKRIVELHRGSIHVASEGRGRGATFTVVLPLAACQRRLERNGTRERAPRAETTHAAPRSSLAGVRVLVVEDDPDMRDLVRIALEQRSMHVETASSAAAAMDILRREAAFDVLVSDVAMPGEDGIALLRRIRRELPERRLAAVALTAFGDEAALATRAAGFDVHVTKPVDVGGLVAAIEKALAASG